MAGEEKTMIKSRSTGKAGIEGRRTTELPSRIDFGKNNLQ